jgi:hypothetical protein
MALTLPQIGVNAWSGDLLAYAGVSPAGGAVPIPRATVVPPPDPNQAGRTLALGEDYASLRSRHDDANSLARAIREGSGPADVRKLYPPYPPGQEERLRELAYLPGLRKQIEALRYPLLPQGQDEAAMSLHADALAGELGVAGRKLLAGLPGHDAISTKRDILEGLARENIFQ